MNLKKDYKKILFFFQKYILKTEIDSAVYFFQSDVEGMKNNKIRNFTKKSYSKEQFNALEWIDTLREDDTKRLKILFQFYTSETFRYFFKRLEEGENIEEGERINFELVAVNEKTGERTKLISANPDEDGIDNNFQEWIMENCSEINPPE